MSKKAFRTVVGAAILGGCAIGAVIAAPSASAAQSTQPFTCDGQQLVIRTNDNHSSDMGGWAAAKIVSGGSGTLIPTSFSGSAYDITAGQPLFAFSSAKGAGNANNNQPTVTCTQTMTGTLADLLQPGDQLPPGTSLTDQVTTTFTATAVHQP